MISLGDILNTYGWSLHYHHVFLEAGSWQQSVKFLIRQNNIYNTDEVWSIIAKNSILPKKHDNIFLCKVFFSAPYGGE